MECLINILFHYLNDINAKTNKQNFQQFYLVLILKISKFDFNY